MRYGISAYAWSASFSDKEIDLIVRAADLGYDVLEIPVSGRNQFTADRVAEVARRHHLECVVGADMTLEADLVHPEPEVRRAGLARLRSCITVAEQIEAQMVAGPFCVASYRFWWPDAERRRADLRYAVDALLEAADYAGSKGIRLALELMNRYETPFCTRAADGLALCEAVNHPAFGLLLDTFHMNIEETSLGQCIRDVGEHLYYLHACENDRGIPGSGHVPWQQVAQALRQIGYDSYVVVESFVYEPEFGQAARVWRPCAANMDALAVDGLRFLKGLFSQPGMARQRLTGTGEQTQRQLKGGKVR